jgi:hypothetical protein
MLAARSLAPVLSTLAPSVLRTMPVSLTRPREESPAAESPSAKRLKMDMDDPTIAEMLLPIEHVKTYEHELDYRDKFVLAPMVRTGSCELTAYK